MSDTEFQGQAAEEAEYWEIASNLLVMRPTQAVRTEPEGDDLLARGASDTSLLCL